MTNQLFIGIDWGKEDSLCASLVECLPDGSRRVVSMAKGAEEVEVLLAMAEADTAICAERADLERMKRSGLIGGAA